ncbi:MAG: rod shape-determining protein MreD, partial [Flavobacteriaceae bacterium]
MITNDLGNLALRFIGLIFVQVLILNNLIVFGQYIPFIPVLFLFWFPMYIPKNIMMVVAFFLGLIIDIFTDTVAFHAFSLSTIAYLRPSILKFCFGNNIEFQSNHFQGTSRAQRLSFLFI